jgi:hypothetical protein
MADDFLSAPWTILHGAIGIPRPSGWTPFGDVNQGQNEPTDMAFAGQQPSADAGNPAAGANDPRTVRSLSSGKVTTSGWQYPDAHDQGLGWRVWVTDGQGGRLGYGHMDPSSTPPVGTAIAPGDYLGVYANPTNGLSTGPHVHVQAYDRFGNPMDPGTASPLTNGVIRTPYNGQDVMNPGKPHNGVDWVFKR